MEEWIRLHCRTEEAQQYIAVRDAWQMDTFMKYKKKGAHFCLKLHSTERGRMPDQAFSDPKIGPRIDLDVEYGSRARKMPSLLESYKSAFQLSFPKDKFRYDPQIGVPAVMLTIELMNDPQYADSKRAEKIVRHFADYLAESMFHWKKLQ